MQWTNAILILPVAQCQAGDQLSILMGHAEEGVSTYSVALVPNQESEPTHYACHVWVRETFRDMIQAAQGGVYPNWPVEMLALAEQVMPHMITAFAESYGVMLDLDSVAASSGLERLLQREQT